MRPERNRPVQLDITRRNANARASRYLCIMPFTLDVRRKPAAVDAVKVDEESAGKVEGMETERLNEEREREEREEREREEARKKTEQTDLIGSISGLDSETPSMYIDIPSAVRDAKRTFSPSSNIF